MTRVVGLGAGGHARVLLEALRLSAPDLEIVGLLDQDRHLWGERIAGIPVLGGDERLTDLCEQGVTHAFVGIAGVGDTTPHRRVYEVARAAGLSMLTIVHPTAIVSPSAELGGGTVVLARSIVNAGARLGDNVVINTAAVVEHDCLIGDHAHVATGAILAGYVSVGAGAHIGAGAVVRQGITIGSGAIVGAGAAVIRDVEANSVVVGVPARPIPIGGRSR